MQYFGIRLRLEVAKKALHKQVFSTLTQCWHKHKVPGNKTDGTTHHLPLYQEKTEQIDFFCAHTKTNGNKQTEEITYKLDLSDVAEVEEL